MFVKCHVNVCIADYVHFLFCRKIFFLQCACVFWVCLVWILSAFACNDIKTCVSIHQKTKRSITKLSLCISVCVKCVYDINSLVLDRIKKKAASTTPRVSRQTEGSRSFTIRRHSLRVNTLYIFMCFIHKMREYKITQYIFYYSQLSTLENNLLVSYIKLRTQILQNFMLYVGNKKGNCLLLLIVSLFMVQLNSEAVCGGYEMVQMIMTFTSAFSMISVYIGTCT